MGVVAHEFHGFLHGSRPTHIKKDSAFSLENSFAGPCDAGGHFDSGAVKVVAPQLREAIQLYL